MGLLRLVSSLKLDVSFAGYCLFYRALLQKIAKETCNSKEPTNRSHPIACDAMKKGSFKRGIGSVFDRERRRMGSNLELV